MGTKSKPRPDAQAPRVPSEPFPSQPGTALANTACPDEFSARLAEYERGMAVSGTVVMVHEATNGDLVVADANGRNIGRLTGVGPHRRRCLLAESYVGVVVKEDGDGPRVQLERIADH